MNTQPGNRRIVHLTSVHLWHDTRVFGRMCRSLARHPGYEVHLVAACDDITKTETHDNVIVHPVPRPSGRLARFTKTSRAVTKTALELDGDLYHFHDPELIPFGWWLAMRGKRVIYDVHENVPNDLTDKHWLHPTVGRLLRGPVDAIERFAAHRFAGIVTADEPLAERFRSSSNDSRQAIAIRNFPFLADFDDYQADSARAEPPTLVCFGGVSRLRAIEPLVEAMGQLPSELNAKLIVSGRCESDELMNTLSRSPGFDRMDYRGWLSHEEMRATLRNASVAINLFSPAPNNYSIRSNRFFESLAYGIPVLTSNFPCWQEMVDKIGCGLTADPEDPTAIAEAIRTLLSDRDTSLEMGKRGRAAIESEYNWESEHARLVELYESLFAA